LDDEARAEFGASADDLLGSAKTRTVDQFDKDCRDLAKSIRAQQNSRADVDELEQQRKQSKISRWVDKQTGMHKTLIECDPVTDRIIWAGIQRERANLRRQQQHGSKGTRAGFDRLQVDALAAAVTNTGSNGAGGRGGRAQPALVVHIDVATLTNGRHPDTVCRTDTGIDIPIDVARRIACDNDIIPIVLNGQGVVLDQGRAKRLATHEQRLAIQAMQTTCSHPDCTITIDDCRIHHINPFSRGGRTNLDELAPLCEADHHLVHEGGWTLTLTPDRIATWTRPDGTIYWTGPLTNQHAA
jgi:5-methylcytosine-specific restriction endonuclease McrA